jgi:RNA-directed DNA polymerase
LFGLAAGANQRWEEPRPWGEAVGVHRLNIGSRMSREAHVRFWERVGVRFPCATRPICHCSSEEQAAALRVALENRFAECGLTLHPEKIVYCKDDDRRGDYPNQKFDFLGYTFRPRPTGWEDRRLVQSGRQQQSSQGDPSDRWSLQERSDKSLDDLARMFNAHIRGWINYYGRFYPSALYPRHIDVILARCRKFKALYRHRTRAIHWLERIARRQTRLFAHWSLLYGRTMGAG